MKRNKIAPLEQIRTDLLSYSIELQPLTHQVSALPTHGDVEFYFVPDQHMEYFAELHEPSQSYKNLKLINYGQPAISVSFYFKHKYSIDRHVTANQALEYVKEHHNYLSNLSLFEQLSDSQQEELHRADDLLHTLRQHADEYQFCFSNYYHYYRYWYCTFRFFEDVDKLKTSTLNEHLLKHTKGSRTTSPQERINLIFADSEYITRPVPYDNKLVDRELDTYSTRITYGTTSLFLKKINT